MEEGIYYKLKEANTSLIHKIICTHMRVQI